MICKDKSKKGQSQINLTLFDTSTFHNAHCAHRAHKIPQKSVIIM